MNPQSILVATDFSDCSGAAFRAAQQLAQTYQAKIILVHVVSDRMITHLADFLAADRETLIPKLRLRAEGQLKEFLERWNAAGLEVETMVAVGVPFQEISVLARDLAVDLVAIGGYGKAGRAGIEEVFFGSTAEKVVRLLPCPVLCVPLEKKGKTAEETET
jgi:nucleotide-binding universal stress UspA family protein|uniref:Universal stress protein n=1 Tax=Desulfobacca acetoxidans TaxID=60893 RepID=A0A7C3Z2L4_9BACT